MISRLFFSLQAQHYKNDSADDHERRQAPLRLHRQPRRPFNQSATASLASRAASRLRSPLTRNSQQRLSVCDFAKTLTPRWASVTEASLGSMANPATASLGVAHVPGQSVQQVKRWSTRALPAQQPSQRHSKSAHMDVRHTNRASVTGMHCGVCLSAPSVCGSAYARTCDALTRAFVSVRAL